MKYLLIVNLILVLTYCIGKTLGEEQSTNTNENVNQRGLLNVLFGGSLKACLCKCGVSIENTRFGTKFLGGDFIEPHTMPWLSMIFLKSSFAANGVLISNRHILTAASPLINATSADTKVALGVHNRCVLDTSTNYSVDAIIIHPEYDSISYANDLALVRLTNFINFNSHIVPICLSFPGAGFKHQHVTIAGWTDSNTTVCRPRRLGIPMLTEAECAKTVTTPTLLTSDKNCIGLIGSSSVICLIDAGIPVQFKNVLGKYELIGIIPNGNVCNSTATNSTLFVNIQHHFSWIKQHIISDCACHKI